MLGDAERPLTGGNSGAVVRKGRTVRRPSGPWTPLVQRLMHELRHGGLAWVPEPFGIDDQGREVVEFVEGEVGNYPLPAWVWSDALLVDSARMLRELHEATRQLDLPRTGWRREAIEPAEVICHGDVAPYNTVFRGGRIVALIDWDYAVPAPVGWDLGYAAYRWVSLTPPDHVDGSAHSWEEQQRRLELFCSAYGDVTPLEVVRWALRRLDDLAQRLRTLAGSGDPLAQAAVDEGHADLYDADAAWLRLAYAGAVDGSHFAGRRFNIRNSIGQADAPNA